MKRRMKLSVVLIGALVIFGGIYLPTTESTSKTLQSLKEYSRIFIQPMTKLFQTAIAKIDSSQEWFWKLWDIWRVDSFSYHLPPVTPPDELQMFLSQELPIRGEVRQIAQLLSQGHWEKSLAAIQQEELAQPGHKALLENIKHFALLSMAQEVLQTGQERHHAYSLLESILKVNPDHIDAQRTLGEMYFMIAKEIQDSITVRTGPLIFYSRRQIVQPGDTFEVDRNQLIKEPWIPIRLKDDGDNLGWVHTSQIKIVRTSDHISTVTIKRKRSRSESDKLFIRAQQLNPSEDMDIKVLVVKYRHTFFPIVISISIVLILLVIFSRNLRKAG